MKASEELAQALIKAYLDAKTYLPKTFIKKGDGEYFGPLKYLVVIVGPQQQELKKFYKFLSEDYYEDAYKNAKNDINLIIIGVGIVDEMLCDKYHTLATKTQEGYFINLDFREESNMKHQYTNDGEWYMRFASVRDTLRRVEASISLLDCKSIPLISELIDFK